MIPLVGITGPFRGPTTWDIEQNVREAEALALEVARLGGMPVCPHTNTRFFQGQGDDDFWLAGTLRLLMACDVLVATHDWARSSGANVEVAEWNRRRPELLFIAECPAAQWAGHPQHEALRAAVARFRGPA